MIYLKKITRKINKYIKDKNEKNIKKLETRNQRKNYYKKIVSNI